LQSFSLCVSSDYLLDDYCDFAETYAYRIASSRVPCHTPNVLLRGLIAGLAGKLKTGCCPLARQDLLIGYGQAIKVDVVDSACFARAAKISSRFAICVPAMPISRTHGVIWKLKSPKPWRGQRLVCGC
jgi:hypothetical protein